MERISLGIQGLDSMTKGGLEKNSITLVSGATGTGKTILALQFLHQGALNNEQGLYLTFDESALSLKETVVGFGWDIDDFNDNVEVIEMNLEDVKELINSNFRVLGDVIKLKEPIRVVVDPITAITDMSDNKSKEEIALENLCAVLRNDGSTTLLLSNTERNPGESKDESVEPFVDSVIAMYLLLRGDAHYHALEVLKMRRTDHLNKRVWFKIDNGITVDYKEYTGIW